MNTGPNVDPNDDTVKPGEFTALKQKLVQQIIAAKVDPNLRMNRLVLDSDNDSDSDSDSDNDNDNDNVNVAPSDLDAAMAMAAHAESVPLPSESDEDNSGTSPERAKDSDDSDDSDIDMSSLANALPRVVPPVPVFAPVVNPIVIQNPLANALPNAAVANLIDPYGVRQHAINPALAFVTPALALEFARWKEREFHITREVRANEEGKRMFSPLNEAAIRGKRKAFEKLI